MDSLGAIFQQIMEAPEKLPDPRKFQQHTYTIGLGDAVARLMTYWVDIVNGCFDGAYIAYCKLILR